jgi:CubicO group peptidase (beta-lactamase class C family)
VERARIPGASLLIGRRGERLHYATGWSIATEETKLQAARDTLYDCASLTKVVVTLPLILMLIDVGELTLADPASRYIPELSGDAITIRHLLTHTAGFPPFVDLHGLGLSREEIVAHIGRLTLEYEPGTAYVYSDLGYILLGEVIARLYGCPLDEAARRHLFGPLGMRDSCFRPDAALRPRIAATEFAPAEGAHRWGRVHDDNALTLGGVSGHAGLFATADDLAEYAEMWLSDGWAKGKSVLSPAIVKLATTSHTAHLPPANRGLGWVLKGDRWDASGDLMSASAYGHTGFTGTSLWIDPAAGVYVVLLTNRVHFGRDVNIAGLRAAVHNIVAASVVEPL